MKTPTFPAPAAAWLRGTPAGFVAAGALLLASAPLSVAGLDDGDVVAVYASVSPAYTRTPLPGGGFKPETYSFGEGDDQAGPMKDFTIDRLHFIDVARRIAPALANRNYLPGKDPDPKHTDLLIMVYWGTTAGTSGAASSELYQRARSIIPPPLPPKPKTPKGTPDADTVSLMQQYLVLEQAMNSAIEQSVMLTTLSNEARDRQNARNASVLGYLPELKRVRTAYSGMSVGSARKDIVEDIEEDRYFVVLLAYDFQTLWKHKQRKLLWETRFSIPAHRHDFGEDLDAMASQAARYFGQDSGGLVRKPAPQTNVKLGDLKVLEAEPAPKK